MKKFIIVMAIAFGGLTAGYLVANSDVAQAGCDSADPTCQS